MPQPRTAFDWAVYRNATLAGLAVLIPFPIVDLFFEERYRRRMLPAIARHRGRQLDPAVRHVFEARESYLSSCLALPVRATWWTIKRLSRKILYVLTVKEATDRISYYWHQAFLFDYMLMADHLNTPESAQVAQQAMQQVLQNTASPLVGLARQVVMSARHVLRTLSRARRGQEDDVLQQIRAQLLSNWSDVEPYFTALAAQYDATYRQMAARPDIRPTP